MESVKSMRKVAIFIPLVVVGITIFSALVTAVVTFLMYHLTGFFMIFFTENVSIILSVLVFAFIIIIALWTAVFCNIHQKAFDIYRDGKGKYTFKEALEVEKET